MNQETLLSLCEFKEYYGYVLCAYLIALIGLIFMIYYQHKILLKKHDALVKIANELP